MAKETPVNLLALEEHPFQERGLPYKRLGAFMGIMLGTTFVTIALMALIYGVHHRNTDSTNVLTRQMAHPLLQRDYRAEFLKIHDEDMEQLDGYGWVDKAAGLAHIPIDRAIEILVQKGLPSREAQK